jgi:hypothetical protein
MALAAERANPSPGGFGGGGTLMQWSVNYRSVRAAVKLTARVGAENAVSLAMNVQETKIRQTEGGECCGRCSVV